MLQKIDAILDTAPPSEQSARLADVMQQFQTIGPQTLCHAHEMKWPVKVWRFHVFRILRELITPA